MRYYSIIRIIDRLRYQDGTGTSIKLPSLRQLSPSLPRVRNPCDVGVGLQLGRKNVSLPFLTLFSPYGESKF
jgi:hypothetical protein